MNSIKRKKIYYTPGIVTLIILPFVFIFYSTKEIKSLTYHVLPVYLADINLPKKHPEWFTKFNGHFPPKRNYLNITFTGNNHDDKIRLDFAQLQIREILSQNDSLNGVHFKFSDNSEYWTFVKAVDILRIEGAKSYIPLDSDLWFFHFPPEPPSKSLAIDCLLCNDVIVVEPKISWWTKTSQQLQNVWNKSWKLILSFAAFLFSLFILRRKKNPGKVVSYCN